MKVWIWAVVGAVIASPIVFIQIRNVRAGSLLDEQLALARTEGIPTNAGEYRALIKPATERENAAAIYRQLRSHRPKGDDVRKAYISLLTTGKTAEAEQVLQANAEGLGLVDKAVARPRCWFDRPWEMGAAVLMPEFADMKTLARAVALRGALSASKGEVSSALADADKIFVISRHCGEEPHTISHLVRDAVYQIGMHALADWSFRFRNPEYAAELKGRLAAFPKPDLRSEQADVLINALGMVELMGTREGRQQIGLRESDIPPIERAAPLIFNQPAAKVNMVKHFRAYWAALDNPKKNDAKLTEAMDAMERDMIAFPAAADVYMKLGNEGGGSLGSWPLQRLLEHQARVLQYTAALRALSLRDIPTKVDTHDLMSPFGNAPVNYRYDGKQMVIDVPGAESKLEIIAR
jgi:hypothetical protein